MLECPEYGQGEEKALKMPKRTPYVAPGATRTGELDYRDKEKPMTIDELRIALRNLLKKQEKDGVNHNGREHEEADELLLAFIKNEEVSNIFRSIEKWYA